MRKIQTIFSYLRAIFIDSGQIILTLVSIVGLVPIFFPSLAEKFGVEEVVSRSIGIVIVLVSFAVANFNLFEGSQKTKYDLYLGRHFTTLRKFATIKEDGFVITENIEIEFVIFFDVANSKQSPTFVDFEINSVKSEWSPLGDLSNIEFKIDSKPSPRNRLQIEGLEAGERRVEFTLLFEAPNDKTDFSYLGLLSELVVVLEVEPQNTRRYKILVDFDVSEIHNKITEFLIRRGTHILHRNNLTKISIDDFITVLKKYWGVENNR